MPAEKYKCTLEEKTYDEGETVCAGSTCMVCITGKWQYEIVEQGCD